MSLAARRLLSLRPTLFSSLLSLQRSNIQIRPLQFPIEKKIISHFSTNPDHNQHQQSHEDNNNSDIPFIIDVNDATFNEAVLKSTIPVIIDFHADWCEPCKKLAPLLEKATLEARGAFRLAKINVDACPNIVKAAQVASIPTLIGFYKGKTLGIFTGGTPSELQKFISSVIASNEDTSKNAAKLKEEAAAYFENGQIDQAVKIFQLFVADKSLNSEAVGLGGLIRCALAEKNLEAAQDIYKQIQEKYAAFLDTSEVRQAHTLLTIALDPSLENVSAISDAELKKKIEENPNDQQLRYDLASYYLSTGKYADSINQTFEMIKRDKHWNDDAAKKLFLKVVDAVGPASELGVKSRKRLGSLWFV